MPTNKNDVSQFEDRLLTEAQAAAFLGLRPATLRSQRSRKNSDGGLVIIPFVKLSGKCIRYTLADLREVIANSRVEG